LSSNGKCIVVLLCDKKQRLKADCNSYCYVGVGRAAKPAFTVCKAAETRNRDDGDDDDDDEWICRACRK